MNQASLYQHANQVQRHDAKLILDEFASTLQWRSDGEDALLDVGSGSGNVLMDFVKPLLPIRGQLVGTDISSQMVGYASKHYQREERTRFQVLDIGCERLPEELSGRFDHVTSFYCLHWVLNLKGALGNIYNLLKPEGGDCLLAFLASNPVYEVYKLLKINEKWSTYMQDVEQFISPLHYSLNPGEEFSHLLNDVGFIQHNVEIRNEVFVYEGVRTLKDNVKAICPFLERMPTDLHEDFLDDFIDIVISMNLQQGERNEDQKFLSPYKLVVAYARKTPEFVNNVLLEPSHQNLLKGIN
ncbi:juvenile hormone acid O-methyltransferase [Drosophila eugracilis]|uniref:juvenile hormone acid O-methyltransferase n=1 Tax=Drosophila eugracilis TaxID=29029 RepID=UPI001BD97206|nr:juvenile hormone acid O-methyltransferase [Drosophila eugracilis]